MFSVVSIGIDPYVHLGPVTLAWHGLTIAAGIGIGGVAAAREARRNEVDPEPITTVAALAVVGALIGARAFFLTWTAPGWYEGGASVDPLPLLRVWERAPLG